MPCSPSEDPRHVELHDADDRDDAQPVERRVAVVEQVEGEEAGRRRRRGARLGGRRFGGAPACGCRHCEHDARSAGYDGRGHEGCYALARRARSRRHRRSVSKRARPHRGARRAAVGGGRDGAVDARREPDEVAPRAHDVVLRGRSCSPASSAGHRWPTSAAASSSTRTTRRSARVTRAPRGAMLSRPSLDEVRALTARTSTSACARSSSRAPGDDAALAVVELGMHHEEQHQELLLTDIKHALSRRTRFARVPSTGAGGRGTPARRRRRSRWAAFDEGHVARSGARRASGLRVRQRDGLATAAFVAPSGSRRRLVTNGEYARVHRRPRLRAPRALALGRLGHGAASGWEAPLYWERRDGARATRRSRSRGGARPVDPDAPRMPRELSTRPTRTRAGRARACRPRPSGRSRRAARAVRGQLRREAGRLAPRARARRRTAADRGSSSATRGSGRRARTCRTRGFRAGRGRPRRVQRQVHVGPDGAARRLVRDAAGAPARDLPQLLPAGDALAVQRHPAGARRVTPGATATAEVARMFGPRQSRIHPKPATHDREGPTS